MAYSRIYARHCAIIDYIRSSKRPTAKDVATHLQGLGEDVTIRTVQRDIDRISVGMEVIKCGSHPDHWYEIAGNSEESTMARTYLEHALMADIMQGEMAAERKHGKVMFTESPGLASGLGHVPLLIAAIRSGNKVRMVYKKFSCEESVREVCPLFLRQYQKRWYLIARDADDRPKTFGLERMVKVERLVEQFKPRKGENHDSMFANVIGLFESEAEPVSIRFWSEEYHAHFLRSVPLHASQQEVGREGKGSLFELTVVPNYEFFQTMLMMGDKVQIVSPEQVRIEIKELIAEMLEAYT